jgi:hypothetical protein
MCKSNAFYRFGQNMAGKLPGKRKCMVVLHPKGKTCSEIGISPILYSIKASVLLR